MAEGVPGDQLASLREGKTRRLGVYFPDLNGLPRGKEIARRDLERVLDGGYGLTMSIFALDYGGDAVEGTGLGPEVVFRDLVVRPDLATLRPAPWMDEGHVVLADVEVDGVPAPFAPRTILKQIVREYREIGLEPVIGVELEYHVLRVAADGSLEPYDDLAGALYMPPGHVFDSQALLPLIHDWVEAMDLPVTLLAREFSPGQYEINLNHDAAVAAVDGAYLFKIAVKEAAASLGLVATFMGRPLDQLGGNGLHFHISLVGEGANRFDDPGGLHGVSDLARSFVAGCMEHLDGSAAVMAPNINAYKRFSTLSLAPYYNTWGLDNRTTTLRVPPERGEATRVEHRLPDGAANLHTSAALVLAAGLDGIKRGLDPGEPFEGNASVMAELDLPKVPMSLRDALAAMERDEFVTGFLGSEFVQAFGALKYAELHRFESTVTEWETRQYARHL